MEHAGAGTSVVLVVDGGVSGGFVGGECGVVRRGCRGVRDAGAGVCGRGLRGDESMLTVPVGIPDRALG